MISRWKKEGFIPSLACCLVCDEQMAAELRLSHQYGLGNFYPGRRFSLGYCALNSKYSGFLGGDSRSGGIIEI